MTLNKYGITERKKAELDALIIEVQNTKDEVQELQVDVTSLTEKNTEFAGFLSVAETTLETALTNKNLVDQVVNDAGNLKLEAKEARKQTDKANNKIQNLTGQVTQVVDQLIFASEMINKLAEMINRKKALNPLISDDMVARITTAVTDANNAVAVTLIAMKACYASFDSGKESKSITGLEYQQADHLFKALTGGEKQAAPLYKTLTGGEKEKASIQRLLHTAYDDAVESKQKALTAMAETTKQLNTAQKELNVATIKLNSLKAGLAAENAAALAA